MITTRFRPPPLVDCTIQSHIPSTHVSDTQASLIDEEVKEMIQKGAVHAVPNPPPPETVLSVLFF